MEAKKREILPVQKDFFTPSPKNTQNPRRERTPVTTTLRPAQERDRALIANIFNIYQHELSVYNDEITYLDENGYFAPDTADQILPFGDGVFPYIVEVDGKNAGILLITASPYAPDDCNWRVEEFFIVRAARGTGAALDAMRQIFSARPGKWNLSVFEKNAPARAFWTKLLAGLHITPEIRPSRDRGMIDLFFTVPEK